MARPKSTPTQPSGLILPYAEAEKLRANPQFKDKIKDAWGHGEFTWYPWQRRVFTYLIDEIGLFGGVGGGKSALVTGWLISGNPHLPTHDDEGKPILHNISYMFHPAYYALVLRKNEKDLWQFIEKANQMYEPHGIVYRNNSFQYPGGGTIVCGHMADQTSWQKYLGNDYVRIVIEEAPLIPELGLYEELRARNRTVFPELRPQIMLSGNYGGPGSAWISDRFMTVKRKDGTPYKPGETIEEEIVHPVTGAIAKRTRIWVFSTFRDNPKFRDSESYPLLLASITDPKKRDAYMDGTWNVFSGSFYGSVWRPERRPNEPSHACHVVSMKKGQDGAWSSPPVRLEPWFHRAIGMDWGFAHEAAVYWSALHAGTQQTHIYRELVAHEEASEKIGYELARRSLDDLNLLPNHAMVLYLSHDAFQKRDATHSTAEYVARGIARVLGPDAVHIPELTIRSMREGWERGGMPTPAEQMAQEKALESIRRQRAAGITIKPAPKASALGWQYIRDLMRWDPILPATMEYDPELARKMFLESPIKYSEYLAACRPPLEEILPKLLVWECCERLIQAIPRLQYKEGEDTVDKAHFLGRDSDDAMHYLLVGQRDDLPPEPFEAFRTRKLTDLQTTNPNLSTVDLVWINRHLEDRWAAQDRHPLVGVLPRGGRARQRQIGPSMGVELYDDDLLG